MRTFPTIILRGGSPIHATRMLNVAMQFARDFADRPSGVRNLAVYAHLDCRYVAYWTKARAVVVRLG